MDAITIYLADDHQILIDGLTAFFREVENIEVIGHANDGMTMIREFHTKKPDVVLLDLNMPKFDGLKTLERISKDFPSVKVIILSNYDQPQLIKTAREAGASGYLLKNGSKAELLEAIAAIKEGHTYFPETQEGPSPEVPVFTDGFKKRHQLTKREVEIIRMVSGGANTPAIAEQLFISENTVSTHRRNIMFKLDVKNVAELIGFAQKNGII